MAVRRFNSNNGDSITLAVGNLVGINTGAYTLAALVRKETDGVFMPMLSAETGTSSRRSLWTTSADVLMSNTGGFNINTPVSFGQADGWAVVAVTKPAGEALIRGHKGVLGGTWTHTDGDQSFDDGSVVDNLKIGTWQGGAFWHGLVAVLGAWERELSDAELEDGLDTSLAAWLDASPGGLWALNQPLIATAVTDLTEGGADQTAISGTSVVTDDDPPGFSFGGATPAPIGAARTVDTARPVVAVRKVPLPVARETSAARALTVVKQPLLSPARERDRAGAVGWAPVPASPGTLVAATTRPTLVAATTRPVLVARTQTGIQPAPPLKNALLNPARFGWPSAAGTGYTGTLEATAGGIDHTTNGSVIENLDIDGVDAGYGLFINADGVTIRNCRIRTTPGAGGGGIVIGPGKSDITIERCELSYAAAGSFASVIAMGEAQCTVRYCHIHHVSEGPRIGTGCVIEHCYIHTLLVDDPDAHADAIQSTGASNYRIHRNTIVADQQGADFANAALILGSEFAESSNIEVTDNLLDGGGFTFFSGPSANFGMSNVLVRGNRFGSQAAFGPISIGDGIVNLTWTDNVMDATNQPVLLS